jgi:hypothetical protein
MSMPSLIVAVGVLFVVAYIIGQYLPTQGIHFHVFSAPAVPGPAQD